MSQPLTVLSIPNDRAILTLISVREKKSMQEIADILGLSIGMVQRYFRFLKEFEYITAELSSGGKNIRPRSTKLTDAGEEMLRLYGHTA